MSAAKKLEIAESALSSIARKVLHATPMNKPWTTHQISGELVRVGCKQDHRTVAGCLSLLKERGLVRETEPGWWVRVQAKKRPEPELVVIQAQPDAPQEPEETAKVEIGERLAGLAGQARGLAAQVMEMATAIEDAALDLEEKIHQMEADTEKLRQLQTLLKSIGSL